MEKSINVIASFGAAIVIIGALFKILHWTGANEMLMVGMFTEAAIFILFGVLLVASDAIIPPLVVSIAPSEKQLLIVHEFASAPVIPPL
jgi:hypothetical protein